MELSIVVNWMGTNRQKTECNGALGAMIGENRKLLTDEPVEFEKELVEDQECRKIIDQSRGIYRIYPNLVKENRRMSTRNRLDSQTLGSQPVIPKNLPDH